MFYGNSKNGYGYSPDRRNDRVDHFNNHSSFIGARGSRQGGYYGQSNGQSGQKKGHYLGSGQWVED